MNMEMEQFQMSSPGQTKQMSFGWVLMFSIFQYIRIIKDRYLWSSKTLFFNKVDQPAGAGFSSGVWDYDEHGIQEDFYAFLQEFYKQLPQYMSNTLYITGGNTFL